LTFALHHGRRRVAMAEAGGLGDWVAASVWRERARRATDAIGVEGDLATLV
jgi:hypothetical protein